MLKVSLLEVGKSDGRRAMATSAFGQHWLRGGDRNSSAMGTSEERYQQICQLSHYRWVR